MSALGAVATGGAAGRLNDDQLEALMAQAEAVGFVDPDPAMRHLWAFFNATRGGEETDPDRIDTGIVAARRAAAAAGPENPHRVFHRMTLALGLWRRHELTLDTGASARPATCWSRPEPRRRASSTRCGSRSTRCWPT